LPMRPNAERTRHQEGCWSRSGQRSAPAQCPGGGLRQRRRAPRSSMRACGSPAAPLQLAARAAAGIAIGGDVFPGSTLSDHCLRYENIPQIKLIVVLGELGGTDEYSLVSIPPPRSLRPRPRAAADVAWCALRTRQHRVRTGRLSGRVCKWGALSGKCHQVSARVGQCQQVFQQACGGCAAGHSLGRSTVRHSECQVAQGWVSGSCGAQVATLP
jgi:hypothetical protein